MLKKMYGGAGKKQTPTPRPVGPQRLPGTPGGMAQRPQQLPQRGQAPKIETLPQMKQPLGRGMPGMMGKAMGAGQGIMNRIQKNRENKVR